MVAKSGQPKAGRESGTTGIIQRHSRVIYVGTALSFTIYLLDEWVIVSVTIQSV